MKRAILASCLLLICFYSAAHAEEDNLEQYVSSFSYQERKDMKIDSRELVKLIKEKKCSL